MTVTYNSNFGETIPFSDTPFQLALATNTNLPLTIPGTATDKYTMLLSYTSTSNVFVSKNSAAVVPGAGLLTNHPYLEYRPGGSDGTKRYVQGGDVINFITPDASAYVGIHLMKLPG
jgi:hypothetical protein